MAEKKSDFRYRKLAGEIEGRIRAGHYQPGEKLPSIRKAQRRLNLSAATVYQAYMELEKVGLIEARPKSGYYVCAPPAAHIPAPARPRGPAAPRKVRLNAMMDDVVEAANDASLVPLGSSATSPDLLPYKYFSRILKGLSARDMKAMLRYTLAEGLPELRRQIAVRHLGLIPGLDADQVVVTAGCLEAVSLALRCVTEPGDTVVVESPTFFGFLQLIQALGLLVVEAPADPRHGVDPAELEKILRRHPVKACLFMPNFHNPLGALMPDARKRDLVDLLNGLDVPLIEDDICAEIYFGPHRPLPAKAYDRKDLVITCSSFSKTLAPGFRLGWAVPGPRYRDQMTALKAGSTVASPTITQFAVAEYLAAGAYERHLVRLRSAVKAQTMKTAAAVQRYFPPDIRMALPQGGPLLWVELNEKADGLEVYRQALERGVSILPGGACSTTGRCRHYIRLGCGFPFTPDTERAVKILGDIVAALSA